MPANVSIVITAQDKASGVLKGVGSALGGIAKVAGAVALAGGAALVGFLSSSVKEASEAENAMAQLNAVLKSTDGAAGMSAIELNKMADSLSSVTRFTDEAIIGAESMLLTFTSIGQDVFPQATETVLDMSQALGQDLQSSAIQLGKALNDPIQGVSALRRVGVQFTDSQEKMIKKLVESGDLLGAQTMILNELNKEFGGSAKAAGETFAGQMDILKNKISNLKEGIGQALMPALSRLGDMFTNVLSDPRVLDFIGKFSTGIASAAEGLRKFFSSSENLDLTNMAQSFREWARSVDWKGLSQGLADGINNIDWQAIGTELRLAAIIVFDGLKTIAEEVDWQALSDALGSALQGVVAGLYGYVSWEALATDFNNGFASLFGYAGAGAFEQLKTDFANGFNFIAGIISTSIEGWKAIIQGFVDFFLTTLTGIIGGALTIFTGLVSAVQGILTVLKSVIQGVLSGITAIFGKTAGDWMSSMAQGVLSGISKVINAIKKMVTGINNALAAIVMPDLFGGGVPKPPSGGGGGSSASGLGGAGGGVGNSNSNNNNGIPAFDGGGIATGSSAGHLAMLHGTEGVFTREQMAMLSPSGGGITINLTYAPAFSTANADELQHNLMPLILQGVKQARRGS